MSNPEFHKSNPSNQEIALYLTREQIFTIITALNYVNNEHLCKVASEFHYADRADSQAVEITAIYDLCQQLNVEVKAHIERVKESIAYVTREFVRRDCGVNGVILSDEDCDTVIREVEKLAIAGKFKHTGTYWIANDLAARDRILRSEEE